MTSKQYFSETADSLGFDPETITKGALKRVLRAAWAERQKFVQQGILTGREARARYERFEQVKAIALSRGIDPTVILTEDRA